MFVFFFGDAVGVGDLEFVSFLDVNAGVAIGFSVSTFFVVDVEFDVHAEVLVVVWGDEAVPEGGGGEDAIFEGPVVFGFGVFGDEEVAVVADKLDGVGWAFAVDDVFGESSSVFCLGCGNCCQQDEGGEGSGQRGGQ